MPHVHISTPFLLLFALFVCALVAIILSFIASIKADRRAAEIEIARLNRGGGVSGPSGVTYVNNPHSGPSAPIGPAPVYAAAPVMMAPGYSGADLAVGMMAGAAIGGAFSHHDTVIVNNGGGYVDSYVAPVDTGFDIGGGSDFGGGGCDVSFGD